MSGTSARTNPARKSSDSLSVAGLFAGIGGIEVGLAGAGHTTRLLCEIDDAACAVLRARFSDTPLVHDVRDLSELPSGTDLVTAGFPCQDLSQAGRTKGITGARSGLVGEVLRLLERDRPPWVLIENVPFMLHLAKGEALEVIVAALEFLEYRWAYRVVDSRAFGLPHRRRRVFMLASRDEDPRAVLFADDAGAQEEPPKSKWREAACGFYWTEGTRGLGWAHDAVPTLKGGSSIGIPSPPAIITPSGDLVTPDIRDAERMQGFRADWTKPALEAVPRDGTRWKLVGNAVTVQVARWIGRRLSVPGTYNDEWDLPFPRVGTWPNAAWNLGKGRMRATRLSEWPQRKRRVPLADFLRFETRPLSGKATRGFFNRASRGRLRFPPGFLDAVKNHLVSHEM